MAIRVAIETVSNLLPSAEQTLFLRACLRPDGGARDAWARWRTGVEGGTSSLPVALAAHKELLPLLFWNLERSGVALERWLVTHFRFACLTETVRCRQYGTICREALGALHAAGIPFIVLKGAALSEHVYPSPILRHTGDIDVLVHEVDLRRSQALFVGMGWSRGPSVRPSHHHLTSMVHPSGVPLELHRRLLIPFYRVAPEALWRRSEPAPVAGVESRILSGSDNLIHICTHAVASGAIMRWVPDAWFIVDRSASLDWSTVADSALSARLALPLSVTLRYLADEIGVPVPGPLLECLQGAARQAGRFERAAACPFPTGTLGEIWTEPGTLLNRLGRTWQRAFPSPLSLEVRLGLRAWQLPIFYAQRLARYLLRPWLPPSRPALPQQACGSRPRRRWR